MYSDASEFKVMLLVDLLQVCVCVCQCYACDINVYIIMTRGYCRVGYSKSY